MRETAGDEVRGWALRVALDLGNQAEEFPGFGTGVGIEEFLRLIHRQHQRRRGRAGLVLAAHEPRRGLPPG